MVFSSMSFLFLFLPVSLLIYYCCALTGRIKLKNAVLLAESIVFCAWGGLLPTVVMAGVTVINFLAARLMEKCNAKNKNKVFAVTCIFDILLLSFFKYAGEAAEITLPAGISFYTFQAISYIADVRRSDTPPQKNILTFGTYICMFPQLIAGPIVRYSTVAKQLEQRNETIERFSSGVERFICGLAKKIILANNLGEIYSQIREISAPSALLVWFCILSFAMQIYFDFSGYSDMAIGLGKMFGFEFEENFNYPYISLSISEFWRRWHISLGTWFREYVYIPLGGSKKSMFRTVLNLMIVWCLTGCWHGANITFILWGAYFGILIAAEKIFLFRLLDKLPHFFRHIYLLSAVTFGWVLFSSDSLQDAALFIRYMFSSPLWTAESLYPIISGAIIFTAGVLFCTPLPSRIFSHILKTPVSEYIKAFGCVAVLILCTAFLLADGYNPFLYFRF